MEYSEEGAATWDGGLKVVEADAEWREAIGGQVLEVRDYLKSPFLL